MRRKNSKSVVWALIKNKRNVPAYTMPADRPRFYRLCLTCLDVEFYDPNYSLPGCSECFKDDPRYNRCSQEAESSGLANDDGGSEEGNKESS